MPIVRLIADPQQLETRLDTATRELEDRGMRVAMAGLLDPAGDVLQLALPEAETGPLMQVLAEHFSPTDMLVGRDDFTLPRLFVSDMDSTMIGQECIDELADFAGIKHQVAAITERAMQGELDFESALRERVMLLRDLSEGAILECLNTRIEPMPGARVLVQTLRANGCRTVLVTGGFHQFADPVAEWLGFDRVVGNRLAIEGGALTGGLVGPVTDSAVKRATLESELAELGEGAVSLATGDGANDVPMLIAADYGVAYHAKQAAKLAANGWIDRGDLTSVLKLLGIPESDWVA
ncbi:MAG: phosphoserine phosphatase [Sphingomonadales bacterium BRH_c3]|nr:MAG: phosphoserine phosphatase [Sphingomonadales bacterium BRH_c3]